MEARHSFCRGATWPGRSTSFLRGNLLIGGSSGKINWIPIRTCEIPAKGSTEDKRDSRLYGVDFFVGFFGGLSVVFQCMWIEIIDGWGLEVASVYNGLLFIVLIIYINFSSI